MRLVIIETPYKSDTPEDLQKNINYARRCMADSLARGEAPFASHLLYTQPGILDDNDPRQRQQGIRAGLEWGFMADATIVYIDLGISPGMQQGIDNANSFGRPVEYRNIGA